MDWRNKLESIQNKIRAQLFARKIDDLEGVYRLMAEFDKDGSGYLDKDEFQKFLSKIGVFLTIQELRSVYDKYDLNKDGNIAYAEFVSLIRENMSEKRIQVVRHAFKFLDKNNEGRLSLDYLMRTYNPANHPRVRTRQKTAQQVMDEFINAIAKRSSDGVKLTENEFLNYYADVNATQPSEKEEYFVDVVISTWGITSGFDYVSPERLAQLEIILFEKIRQKTLPKDDEGKTVRKAFKYFDVLDKGIIDIQQFAQALAKFGCCFSDKEIQALFNKYDTDKSGKLCYDEFCGLISLMGSGKNANLNPVFQIAREPPVQTLQKIKGELVKKGQHAVRKMARIFENSDKNKNGTLNRQEFQWAMKESGILLTKTEYDNIFKYFDKNCDDEVSFLEFIAFLRIPLNERRLQVVDQTWQKITPDQTTTLENLKSKYDGQKSWDVLKGVKSPSEADKDFQTQWDPVISREQFFEYYTDVSGLIDDDNSFENMVRGSWRL